MSFDIKNEDEDKLIEITSGALFVCTQRFVTFDVSTINQVVVSKGDFLILNKFDLRLMQSVDEIISLWLLFTHISKLLKFNRTLTIPKTLCEYSPDDTFSMMISLFSLEFHGLRLV